MSVILVASAEPRAGRSTIAAAIATRLSRDGARVSLVRLGDDDSARADAAVFAGIATVQSPGSPVAPADIASSADTVVAEAPAGDVGQLLSQLPGARVIVIGGVASPALAVPSDALAGSVVTRVSASETAAFAGRAGVLSALPEDRQLAAPSVADIVAALQARSLVEADGPGAIGRVMIGTVASDAASPYFDDHESTCVVTRFDKTDIQLAALNTDLRCLVLTGGGDPSPYLLDRVAGGRDPVTVLLAEGTTVEAMRTIEALYGRSRFAGQAKLDRAVELLDTAGFALPLKPLMRVLEVIDGVHAVDCGGIVWAYLFVERDRVTLVDTGIAGSATLIFDALASVRRKQADIKLVVVTHYHKDHVGSLAEIVETTGAECVAHPLDAPVVRGERPEDPPRIWDAERPFYEEALVRGGQAAAHARVDRLVDDGDVLECLGGTTVVHVPGHTPGSIALYAPQRRLIVTGDAVAAFDGAPIVGLFNVDRRQARESTKKLAALDFDVACFGHGEPLLRDASTALRSLAAQLP